MFKKLLLTVVAFLFTAGAAFAQTGTLTGSVTDASSGEPLPGVNVFIPDLQRGAATDAEGQFTIEGIEYGTYTVRASFIGYTTFEQEVTIEQESVTLDIELAAGTQQLEDIVVTALGIERKAKDLTYSAENVNVEDVTMSGSDNFMSALTGKVAGMKVQSKGGMGGSTDIILRGANSLTGNNQVLFVVDGVPYANERFNTEDMEGGFAGYDYGNTGADINPENIASMTVLKGPTAAALYGSRAANGAIVIETKKGSPADQNVQVTCNSSFGISKINKNTFPDYQEKYGAGYAPSFIKKPAIFTDQPEDSVMSVRLSADGSLGPRMDGQMVYQWDAFTKGSPNYGKQTPFVYPENDASEFFETGTNAQNSLMINGSLTEDGYYNIGYTQGNTRGIMPNSSLDEHKLNFKGGYNITDRLNVGAAINYSKTEGKGRPLRGYSTMMSLFRQWWQTNLDITQLKDAYLRNKTNATWNLNTSFDAPLYWDNPYWYRYERFSTDDRDRYVGNVNASYEVTDWFSLKGRMSLDHFTQLIEERINKGSVAVGSYSRRNISFSDYNYDLQALFDRSLSEDLSIDGVLGMNIRRNYVNIIEAETNGGLVVPRLYSLNNSQNAVPYPDETDSYKKGVNGFFASVNLNYGGFLTLNMTGRRDKSSSLPEGENVYYYPSASAGFTFSEFIDSDILSFGKIRAGWSEVGNSAPAQSLYVTYDRATNFGSAALYTLPGTRNNPNLKPERTKSWQVGMQLGFVNDRIFLDATYYDENSIDQILPADISRATGYASSFINAGNVENRGLELSLTARPVVTNDFSWSLTANWSKNISKVKALTEGVSFFPMKDPQGGVLIGADVGEPLGVIRGSDFVYNENGQRVIAEDGTYSVSTTSNNVIGDMNPEWSGGISNNLSYKNWSLNFLVDVRWGGDLFSLDQWYGQGTGLYKSTVGQNNLGNPIRDPAYTYDDDGNRTGLLPEEERGGLILPGVLGDWADAKDENGNDKYPNKSPGDPNDVYANGVDSFGYNSNPNARYVYDASFVKLREVGITYNLPQSLLSELKVLRGASVSVTGRNLWIIHKNLPDADPEMSIGDGSLQGYQGGNLPATRNVTFNLQLKF